MKLTDYPMVPNNFDRSDPNGFIRVPLSVAEAADRVMEAAKEVEMWAGCKCYDDKVCAMCKVKQALAAYEEATRDN